MLLLDEPLGALDKKLREETQFELMDLQQELGLTFIVVTHDQEEAMTMADRIAVMDKGEVDAGGDAAEVYEAPDSRFVADFVGYVNIFEGRSPAATTAASTIATADGVTHPRRRCRRGAPGEGDGLVRRAAGKDRDLVTTSRQTRRSTRSRARSGTSAISATCRSTTSS